MGPKDDRSHDAGAAVRLAAALAAEENPDVVARQVAVAAGTAAGVAAVVLAVDREPQACEVVGRHAPAGAEEQIDQAWVLQAAKSGEPLIQTPAGPGQGQVTCFPTPAAAGVVALLHPPGDRRGLAELADAGAVAQVGGLALARARAAARCQQAEADRDDLLARLVTAEEQERRRIAAGLHDDAIQALAAALTDLRMVGAGPEHRRVERASRRIEQALETTRTLLFNLRPLMLEARGLGPAIRQQLDTVVEETGCVATLDWDAGDRPHPLTETVVFRTVQEALTNVAKHARPGRVAVRGRCDGQVIEVRVDDDGAGFDTGRAAAELPRGHLGLRTMTERVEVAGGTFQLTSSPGGGTRIRFRVPLR